MSITQPAGVKHATSPTRHDHPCGLILQQISAISLALAPPIGENLWGWRKGPISARLAAGSAIKIDIDPNDRRPMTADQGLPRQQYHRAMKAGRITKRLAVNR